MTASGLGSEREAYKQILFNLCKTGCTITKIRIIPSLLSTTILYEVEGNKAEIDAFKSTHNK
jgi:hypothetical protein